MLFEYQQKTELVDSFQRPMLQPAVAGFGGGMLYIVYTCKQVLGVCSLPSYCLLVHMLS